MKIDLHVHTQASPDASITHQDLLKAYQAGRFDLVAITDHDTISKALHIKASNSFPVIVGQEISTRSGEIIGLFLKSPIPKKLLLEEAVFQVKKQGGLVLVPHPLDPVRIGLTRSTLKNHYHLFDLIEVLNGRAQVIFPSWFYQQKVNRLLNEIQLTPTAGSDAHEPYQLGRCYLEYPSPAERSKKLAQRASQDPSFLLQLAGDAQVKTRLSPEIFARGKNFFKEWFYLGWRELNRQLNPPD